VARSSKPVVADAGDLQRFIEVHDITTFKAGAVDIDGVWRGKRIAAEYFADSVWRKGTNICNILFGWDLHDVPIPGLAYTGWQTAYPDVVLVPDLSTLAVVPWEPGTASVICDVHERDGAPQPLSPRALLRRVTEQAAAAGYEAMCGYEFEFYVLRGTPEELASRGFRDIEPLTHGNHTYSLYRDTGSEYILGDIRKHLAAYGIYIEASNSEHGPGQFEVNFRYTDALQAADQAMMLKHSVKEIAASHGCTASFIAKLSPEWAGSSAHLHQSLHGPDGTPAFANPADPGRLSATGEAYLAGVLDLAKDFTALYLPTINSYKRTEGGSWAGSSVTWGTDNRTVAVRAIPDSGPAARIENRVPGADANPYLVIAGNLAAGLHGIGKGLAPPAAVTGNAYELADDTVALPASLEAAAEALACSTTARTLLGDAFVDHFAATRRWEVNQSRSAVTDWEIARYLEHT
jgi:glutamine synthetase